MGESLRKSKEQTGGSSKEVGRSNIESSGTVAWVNKAGSILNIDAARHSRTGDVYILEDGLTSQTCQCRSSPIKYKPLHTSATAGLH